MTVGCRGFLVGSKIEKMINCGEMNLGPSRDLLSFIYLFYFFLSLLKREEQETMLTRGSAGWHGGPVGSMPAMLPTPSNTQEGKKLKFKKNKIIRFFFFFFFYRLLAPNKKFFWPFAIPFYHLFN
jgi:hypothetical protein